VWPGERKLEIFAADYVANTGSTTNQWVRPYDQDRVLVEALLVAGGQVVAACAPARQDSSKVRSGSWGVLVLDKQTGQQAASVEVGTGLGPRFDGMAAAGGRLFVSTKDGAVVCLK
jgi:hypothetical protein